MVYILVGMALVFLFIGWLITEQNAKYYLAGYNTMSDIEQAEFDLARYIPFFRQFHLLLGVSFLLLGLGLYFWVSETAAGIFLSIYPILAYIYFITRSANFSRGVHPRTRKVGLGVLIAALLLVVGLLGMGLSENDLVIHPDSIEIEGIYGEKIPVTDIASVGIVDRVPPLKMRTNGFGLGPVKKGYFKTKDDEKVKLFVNARKQPLLAVTKKSGNKLYYVGKKTPTQDILTEIQRVFPLLHIDRPAQ